MRTNHEVDDNTLIKNPTKHAGCWSIRASHQNWKLVGWFTLGCSSYFFTFSNSPQQSFSLIRFLWCFIARTEVHHIRMKSFYDLIVVLVAPASHFLLFFWLFSQFCFRDNSWQEKVLQLGEVRPGYKGYGITTCPTLSRENQTDGSTEWQWRGSECQWCSYCQLKSVECRWGCWPEPGAGHG